VAFFNFLSSLFTNDIGMDLGTSNTLVYVKGKGIVLQEPSVVAIDTNRGRVLAVGVEAKRMLGRTPVNIVAKRPLKNGVIADFDATEKMISHFVKRARASFSFLRPRIVIGVPSGITQVERRAVKEAAEAAGAREVFLIEEPCCGDRQRYGCRRTVGADDCGYRRRNDGNGRDFPRGNGYFAFYSRWRRRDGFRHRGFFQKKA